jgi:hypothetical protein
MAITSKEINLAQLDKELGGKGLIADFNDPDNKLILPADNSTISEYELEAAIKIHVAQPTEADAKAAQRQLLLDQLGISADEAKLLLG